MSKYALFVVCLCASLSSWAQTKHLVTANANNTFTPATLSIAVGDTVMWTNNGGNHNVNGSTDIYGDNPESFSNGALSTAAWTFAYVFTIPGTYVYQCDAHVSLGMTGSITVNDPAAGVVISEIMYNPPGADTDLEYVELYNSSTNAVNLLGYSFEGFTFTFPGFNLGAGEYVVVAVDSVIFEDTFGSIAFQFQSGALNNGGEAIRLFDGEGGLVDEVSYEPDGDWPAAANGLGASLVLCDPLSDNGDPASWAAATTDAAAVVSGFPVYANPGAASQCAEGPMISIAMEDLIVGEDAGTIAIPVVLSQGDPESTTSVSIVLGAGTTAEEGIDFSYEPAMITFAAGAVSDTVLLNLTIVDDVLEETLDTIILELNTPSAAASIDVFAGAITVVIQDNDAAIPAIVITEIMYNPPESGTDSLEFIELYNNGDMAVDLTDYYFSEGITFTFPQFSLEPGAYTVIAVNSAAINNVFGVSAFQFTGALGNGGEPITLANPGGTEVTSVTYSDTAPWPTEPDGAGPSLVLCDPDADGNDGANWSASSTDSGAIINGVAVLASPGAADVCTPPVEVAYPVYDISIVNTEDESGVADSIGVKAEIQGIVYGVNLRPAGLEFTVIDADGDGIGAFNSGANFGYTVMEGDEVMIRGTIGQFNGLTQISVDTIAMLSAGNDLLPSTAVTALDETTESQLVTLENVSLVDPAQWNESGSSFNISVTNGVDTFLVRIDADVDIAGSAAPTGAFNVTGIGSQFDNSSPYTEGYQLLPRYQGDIELLSSTLDPSLARFIKVYPNPTANLLQLDLQQDFDVVQLYNAFGQQLLERYEPQANEQVDLGQYARGMYTLTFVKGNRIWSMSVIKQ